MMKMLLFILFVSLQLKAQNVWVNSYTTSEGTYVEGYYRTPPDNTVNNNYNTLGNVNPHTGDWGTKPRESSYYYDVNYVGSTNPLANVMPAPVSKVESDYYKSEAKHIESLYQSKDTAFESEYSQNYKDYLYEKEHPQPLKDFEDNKAKFHTYQIPTDVPDTENKLGATVGFLLFATLLLFVLLFFIIPKTKKYMTFEEALKVKNTYPVPYKANGTHYIVKIVPALTDDYARFLADFRHQDLSDEDAKKYSTNGKFKVEGLICVAFNIHQLPLT